LLPDPLINDRLSSTRSAPFFPTKWRSKLCLFLEDTGLGKVFTKPVDEIYADVCAVPKANRPPVETYMSKPLLG